MGKDISFKNHDRFIHLGIAIAALRKMRGMSQEQLAEKAGISRSLISAIEAPGLAKSFSLDVFFNLADALDIDPADLINATVFPDRIFKQKYLYLFSFMKKRALLGKHAEIYFQNNYTRSDLTRIIL